MIIGSGLFKLKKIKIIGDIFERLCRKDRVLTANKLQIIC